MGAPGPDLIASRARLRSPRRRGKPQRQNTGRTRRSGVFYHPRWGNHGEELLFHTSRYYACTEDFLRRVSGSRGFGMGAYRAQRLSDTDRNVMARLLRRPPGRATARAVIALMSRLQGCGKRPPRRNPRIIRRAMGTWVAPAPRQRRSDLPPEDPFLNLAARFALPVRRQGHHLWIPLATLRPLLDASHPALRQAFHDAIEQLHEGGFHLHGMHREG